LTIPPASPIQDRPLLQETIVNVKDAHGNPLADGDSVTVIKDLKVKGT